MNRGVHILIAVLIAALAAAPGAAAVLSSTPLQGTDGRLAPFASRIDVPRGVSISTEEVIVKFKGQERFTRVNVPRFSSVQKTLERYRNRANVVYAEPNYTAHALYVPNDEYYRYQWHMDNAKYGGIQTEEAWDITRGDGVVIAVIDTRIAYEDRSFFVRQAPDLKGTTFVAGYDFVSGDSRPHDDNGHGTHVAGSA